MKKSVLAAASLLASYVTALSQPAFLFEPQDASASVGANVLFQCVAFGEGPLTYQWYRNGAALPGETFDALLLNNVSQANAGEYVVVATIFSGSVTSTVATLSVDGAFTKVTSGPLVNDPGSSLPAAWGDYDNDGFPDVFIPKAGTDFNYLYRNNGDGTFSRVISGPPVSDYANTRAAVWADFNNDGLLDLLAGNSGIGGGGFFPPGGTNILYQNLGNGNFVRVAGGEGQLGGDTAAATSLAWADIDADGLLDVYVGVNLSQNVLYRNAGNGTLSRVIAGSIVTENFKVTTSVVWGDYNNDGLPDALVVNQPPPFSFGNFRVGEEILYANNGDGTFARQTNIITTAGGSSQSATWVDYDGDLDLDLFVVNNNGQNSYLYRNDAGTNFTAITTGELVNDGSERGNSISSAWGDYNNDGWIDVFVTNDGALGNFLYHNNGDGTFTSVQMGSLTGDRANSFGSTWVDVDRDGWLDLFVSNVSGENHLYRNNAGANAWIDIQLAGEASNRSGIGAKVKILATIGGVQRWQMRQITAHSGTYGLSAHFGLGNASSIETVRIEWPSGIVQELQNVAVNQFLSVKESPSIGMSAGSRFEGDNGLRPVEFTVRLSQPTNTTVTVDFFTSDLTAEAGVDYVSTNGTIVFAPNQTTQTLAVYMIGDLLDETNETFLVHLTNSTVLPIKVRRVAGTIIDDEPLTMAIADAVLYEGEPPTNSAAFVVSLLKPVDYEVTVEFATRGGVVGNIATSDADFIPTNGALRFAPGETEKLITVSSINDGLDELNENFLVELTNVVNAVLVDSQASGLIVDDDPFPTVNLTSASLFEGDAGSRPMVFEANLSAPSGTTITVQYATSNLTAFAGLDFTFALGTLTFPPGTTNRTITVSINGDTVIEPDETFFVNLYNPSRVTVGSLGFAAILDDDLRLTQAAMSGGGFALSFRTATGRNYRVEWTGQLANPTSWQTLTGYETVVGTGGLIQVQDPLAGTQAQRFYRVIQLGQ